MRTVALNEKEEQAMKLLLKQRMISRFYDIYDEAGNTMFVAKNDRIGEHLLHIFDANGIEAGYMRGKDLDWFPVFEMYVDRSYVGTVSKEHSLFKARYNMDFNGWHMEGDSLERDYTVVNSTGQSVASVSKRLWKWRRTYEINIRNSNDALYVLMFVLAVDAEKCSRSEY